MAKKQKNKTSGENEILPVIERELKVELTPQQSKERLGEAFDLQGVIDSAQKEKDELVADHKAALDAVKETIEESEKRKSQICRGVSLVKCEPVKNYETKMMEYWHPNFAHGKKYEERDFTAEEHQRHMFEEQNESIPSTGSDPFASEGAQA